jgi:hypothetical protein
MHDWKLLRRKRKECGREACDDELDVSCKFTLRNFQPYYNG